MSGRSTPRSYPAPPSRLNMVTSDWKNKKTCDGQNAKLEASKRPQTNEQCLLAMFTSFMELMLSQTEAQSLSLLFHLCGISASCQSSFVPLGPITSIGQQPACPSHLPLDSLSVSPDRRPASQSKGRESKGATYQVDYQEVLLWLITTKCAHNEGC